MIGVPKPSPGELSHHGVKGMHWHQHKFVPSTERAKAAAAFTKTKATNVVDYARQHKSQIAGALVVARLLQVVGTTALHAGKTGILFKAAQNREAAYAAGKVAVKALSSTAAKVNYAKMVRGAYKITTL